MKGGLRRPHSCAIFAGDLPEGRARVLYAVQQPFHRALLMGKTRHAAWRSKPSFYAVSTEDRTINPDLERFMAKRMGATTIEVRASLVLLCRYGDDSGRRIAPLAARWRANQVYIASLALLGSP